MKYGLLEGRIWNYLKKGKLLRRLSLFFGDCFTFYFSLFLISALFESRVKNGKLAVAALL